MLAFALSAVFVLSVAGLLLRIAEYRSAAREYAAIAAGMGDVPTPVLTPAPKEGNSAAVLTPAPTAIPAVTQIPYFSQQMRSLKAQNSDTVGFLEITGTSICYPVVKGSDNQYYQDHTFLKKRNASGAIFMDCKNAASLDDFNLVIYGHNMKDGSMFHDLLQYRKTGFLTEHRNIVLTGLFTKKTYYVFSVYTCSQNTDVRGFDRDTEWEKQTFLSSLKSRSDISPGAASLSARGQILTLVTCRENSAGDFFVVHAVLVKEE